MRGGRRGVASGLTTRPPSRLSRATALWRGGPPRGRLPELHARGFNQSCEDLVRCWALPTEAGPISTDVGPILAEVDANLTSDPTRLSLGPSRPRSGRNRPILSRVRPELGPLRAKSGTIRLKLGPCRYEASIRAKLEPQSGDRQQLESVWRDCSVDGPNSLANICSRFPAGAASVFPRLGAARG